MCLPERDVRKGGHIQVALLCLVEGLRDVRLVDKGSGDEGGICEEVENYSAINDRTKMRAIGEDGEG